MSSNRTWLIFLATVILLSVGVVMVFSASGAIAARAAQPGMATIETSLAAVEPGSEPESIHDYKYLRQQAVWVALGILILFAAYQTDYERYRTMAAPLLILAGVLLLLVWMPGLGRKVNGAYRWVDFGGFQMQPSEFTKLAMIIYMAKKLSALGPKVRSFTEGFIPLLIILVGFCLVILAEPDLGASFVIFAIVYTMFFAAGMRIAHLATLALLAIPAITAAIIMVPWRLTRLTAFLDPEADRFRAGYQLFQSLVAIGTGGVTGLGLGEGPQKYLFLSDAYTDFIYAVICEELGLVGALFVAGLYVFFCVQGMRVAARASSPFPRLLAVGITAMIGIPAFINMFVVTGMLPTKGLTLPLISYGGSSLMINLAAIGILMNVSRDVEISAVPARRLRPGYA